jgi:hypothetical protein
VTGSVRDLNLPHGTHFRLLSAGEECLRLFRFLVLGTGFRCQRQELLVKRYRRRPITGGLALAAPATPGGASPFS